VVLKRIILKARKGDTLAGFASKNGVSVANLASWNKLNMNAPLKAGQSIALLIPTTQGRYLAKGLQNKPASTHAVYSASKANPHTVRSASAAPQLHKRHTPSVKVAKK